MEFMVLDYGSVPAPGVEAQERKKPVVERHGHIHVFDGYLHVVDDWFHRTSPANILPDREAVDPMLPDRMTSATVVTKDRSASSLIKAFPFVLPGFDTGLNELNNDSVGARVRCVHRDLKAMTRDNRAAALAPAALLHRRLPSKQTQAGVPEGRNVSGAPPRESAPWAPSTGTCSLRPSARASRTPWRRRMDATGRHRAGPGLASGSCARNRASR